MQTVEPIPVELAFRDATPLQRFFKRKAQVKAPTPGVAGLDEKPKESDLLKAIRSVLRGSKDDTANPITSQLYPCPSNDLSAEEEELTWDTYNVMLGSGGVVRKKWSFEEEGQSVQWACVGSFEVPAAVENTTRAGHYTSEDQDYQEVALQGDNQRPTFGPFARIRNEAKTEQEPPLRCRAVFVFLRSVGRVFFMNGLEHTFYLPFIVRRAWALFPHGVLMQRVLEPNELEEVKASGEELLPTLFTMINPFAEASTVGLTPAIKDGLPDILKEDDPETQLESIPAHEHIVWTSEPSTDPMNNIVVSLNDEAKTLSVWRYIYVHPRDIPKPLPRKETRRTPRSRASLSGPFSPSQTSFNSITMEQPPLASLPGAPPALTMTTMAAVVPGSIPNAPPIAAPPPPFGRQEHQVNLDKATVGGRVDSAPYIDPVDHSRMKPSFWMEKLWSCEVSADDIAESKSISVGLFDRRWNGEVEHLQIAICLPRDRRAYVLPITQREGAAQVLAGEHVCLSAISVAPIRALRSRIYDLLLLRPDGSLAILTHGLLEIPLHIQGTSTNRIAALKDPVDSSVTMCYQDGISRRTTMKLYPTRSLTVQTLQILSIILPKKEFFSVHHSFLLHWSRSGFNQADQISFQALSSTIYAFLSVTKDGAPRDTPSAWDALRLSSSLGRYQDDPALRGLRLPLPSGRSEPAPPKSWKPSPFHGVVLIGLHYVAQDRLLNTHLHDSLSVLVPVLCRLAMIVRPEWADYWKRLLPDAMGPWPSPAKSVTSHLDDRLPVTPPDAFTSLWSVLARPAWSAVSDPEEPWTALLPTDTRPSLAFGEVDPLTRLHALLQVYRQFDDKEATTRERAESTLMAVLQERHPVLDKLPIGPAAALREALRTCQLNPSGNWPLAAYQLVGRNDLAEGLSSSPEPLSSGGYRSVKDYILPSFSRKSIHELTDDTRWALIGEPLAAPGPDVEFEEFAHIRFGQDRRIEEVTRLLSSSKVSVLKTSERPELNEHDQAKEHQLQVLRVAERTLALPPGRALFTFGAVSTVTREAYVIPRIEYSIRVYPQNQLIVPEPGKIPHECAAWGDFHNGVAAGLRIAPNATGVQSSWIKFNKPSELTPEHAGFLYALGLTGHLREMLTWHTFAYLTPKHDLTSIAVLLGLAAANAGTRNRHVTKLIAVHTPALLPTPDVDLNVPLITQAAGISGIGLLYMGTKNRRMAEVCLSQISRRDLVQPDLSNEYREAYTFSAALAFGMVMLGKGSDVPADLALLARLRTLIQGDAHAHAALRHQRPAFDVNLTSPAATIALGLMYLRTERRDVADILTIPDTVLTLDRIQPSFLLLRTLARCLILFDGIRPTNEWLMAQLPASIRTAMDDKQKGKAVHESFELAYYNIIAGACFAVALKYAGTAREEAYLLLIRYNDMFTQLAYSNTPAIEHRIKRAAIRDGLNTISVSLNMIMAGTGEINCLRRLRYSFGMQNLNFKYGTHVMVHMSLGLLFLGGGKYTLGTSDAAIACLVTAFFPRFNQVSSDNKTYLQALRHLWVLAVEPRCLVTRDVDTKEVVYLPVKIKVKDETGIGSTQLIAPTLVPDVDRIHSIRVDTPRYWPFYLDIANMPHHKESLLRSQTLYVKRRSAFLSYTEDPKGSRSLFVRSGSSAGDAAVLDFPQLKLDNQHPATDLHEFISSYSNDAFFLAFADRFCRDEGQTEQERLFLAYCHATLLDSILQDKSSTIQTHLTLYRYRTMPMESRCIGLAQQDLRFAAEFYGKVFMRWFSGISENNVRPPLLRDSTLRAASLQQDDQLQAFRAHKAFTSLLRQYIRGAGIPAYDRDTHRTEHDLSRSFAMYLQRHNVPVSTLLVVLKALAVSSHARCMQAPPPHGTDDEPLLDEAIKEVVHATGLQMTTSVGSGWSLSSLEEIMATWSAENEEAAPAADVRMVASG